MSETKLIFLDFDGVMNGMDNIYSRFKLENRSEYRDDYGQLFDERCVRHLKRLIKETKAKIVVSSTWRYSGLKTMQDMWKFRNLPGEIIGITSCNRAPEELKQITSDFWNSSEFGDRGNEIEGYLRWMNYDIKSYVILDDDVDFGQDQLDNHFVKCDTRFGLTGEDIDKAIEILNGTI
jgi:hypothetical protein